jgi:hypothetical protein
VVRSARLKESIERWPESEDVMSHHLTKLEQGLVHAVTDDQVPGGREP